MGRAFRASQQGGIDGLLHGIEHTGIGLAMLPGKELHGPVLDQLFGGKLFPDAQFGERAIE